MRKFIQWLVEEKTELPIVPQDNRELIFGAYGAMKQFIPQIAEFGKNDTQKAKLGGQQYEIASDTNPYLLVVWDNNRKLLARGSNNCAVCTNYNVAKGTCELYGKSSPMTQSFVTRHDIGGCVGLDFLPSFGSGGEQSKRYEGLQFALAKGYIFRYANGQVDTKPLSGPFVVDAKEKEIEELSPWERQERGY